MWGHIEPEILNLLVQRNGSIFGVRQYYRGWTGLSKFEQIAEREIWIQSGWSWLNYLKAGKVLTMEEVASGNFGLSHRNRMPSL